jgi:hypothetical protein
LSRTGKTVRDQAAIAIRLLLEIPNGREAEMCEVVSGESTRVVIVVRVLADVAIEAPALILTFPL